MDKYTVCLMIKEMILVTF